MYGLSAAVSEVPKVGIHWNLGLGTRFSPKVSTGDESMMDARWPLAVARRKEPRTPDTGLMLGRLMSGVGGCGILGGVLGTWEWRFHADGGIIIDAFVIVDIGMQWFSMAIPKNKNP